ncbi:uncharacterized protein A1O5_06281 [Cladophialophora psammophila CBS 110553]|uniref:CsbD-like domain-containing protein n=1 Tax=Cladophialophora psammophila CBS 110553 TaxID=1182543 RepID=W9WQL5_9EURO|nr:uncharacterized protein A1O5_06281 [Cladophialophora psammophila CBS 110553]EXJ70213.1 hypothetical protein A1O5_06281 [Cladophialophora psammophila CBS 110553]
MADRTQDKTHEAVGDVKSVLKGIKGMGDTLRGSVNESIDTAFNDREGEIKNKAVKEKGEAELHQADSRFGGTAARGTTTTAGGTTTGAGAHSGGVGNMSSTVPQGRLGGEPTTTRERF